VLAKDVEGVQAGKEALVMSVRASEVAILLGYRREERLGACARANLGGLA
jgi:hypothetical protein